MAGMFSTPKSPKTPKTKIDDPAIKEAEEEAKRKERLLQKKKQGRAATILTGAMGVAPDQASVKRKTLLG